VQVFRFAALQQKGTITVHFWCTAWRPKQDTRHHPKSNKKAPAGSMPYARPKARCGPISAFRNDPCANRRPVGNRAEQMTVADNQEEGEM
jgi:hypothetical protein